MNERQWYYIKDGQQYGPVSEARLVELFREGTLGPTTQVWTEGLDNWSQASQIDGLVRLAESALPTAPSVSPQSSADTRPTVVTVFGVLNIVFGGLGLLSMPCGLIVLFAMPNIMNPTEGVKVWLLFGSIVGFACTILLIAVGIGLLKLRAWARKWCLIYGWFAIAWGIIGTIINILLITSGAYGYSDDAAPSAIGGVLGGLIGLVYPILLVIFMQKPNVKNVCTR